MAEYIEREAVIELLEDKQRAICPAGRYGRGYVYGRDRDEYDAIDADIDTVQNIPAADVVEVVRCKDCRNCTPFYGDKGLCYLWADGIDVFLDGFCNYGVKMEG